MATQDHVPNTDVQCGRDTSSQRPSAIARGVMAMHQQGEPDELIAVALGLPVLQIRNMITEQLRAREASKRDDDPAPIIRRVPRKSRHPDRCPDCGAMLTIKPCLLCYCRTWAG